MWMWLFIHALIPILVQFIYVNNLLMSPRITNVAIPIDDTKGELFFIKSISVLTFYALLGLVDNKVSIGLGNGLAPKGT